MLSYPGELVHIQITDQSGPYRAGACNIGPEEIARRRRSAIAATVATIAIAAALLVIGAAPITRLAVFPFLAGAIVSEEQVRRRFCVGFGLAGIRNFGRLGTAESITDAADRAADRRAALVVIAYSSLIALVVTLAFVALPV